MKLSRLLTGLSLLFLISNVCKAQFLTLLGSFSYSLNSINQVFDISPDGKIAVAMRNDPSTVQPAFLTTFNPLTGAQFVDTLAANTGDPQNPLASAALSQAERDQLASNLSTGAKTRVQVLRAVAENAETVSSSTRLSC
ncbi:MAG: hypothetical protein QOH51_3390 [Acidobacteriota bacterium]|jgi:hypothetical protein|nr:hypothetical protein [Acidobacteriota bacterium]